MRSIGKRDCGNLFKLGDDMIQFGGLHALLAASVADMLPVNVSNLLLREELMMESPISGKLCSPAEGQSLFRSSLCRPWLKP